MAVLDHEQGRHHQDPLEEGLDGPVELVAARGRVECGRLRGGVDLRVERDREQRQPRCQVGHHPRHERLQHRPGLGGGAVGRDADELAQRRPDGGERLGRRVLLGRPVELLEAERERPQLLHEARLADARLAHELDHLQLPHAREVDRLLQLLDLGFAADDRRQVRLLLRPLADHVADRVCHHRLLLALHEQRLRLGGVDRAGAVEHVGRRQDPARPARGP